MPHHNKFVEYNFLICKMEKSITEREDGICEKYLALGNGKQLVK